MTLVVYTEKRYVYVECEERRTVVRHRIPKRNKFFKEELRRYVEEIQEWLTGSKVDEITFMFQDDMDWHHKALYQAVLRACRRSDGLVLVQACIDGEEVLASGSTD